MLDAGAFVTAGLPSAAFPTLFLSRAGRAGTVTFLSKKKRPLKHGFVLKGRKAAYPVQGIGEL
ncbi:hypothetical protein GCM10025871_08770 [Deinococcus metallilatus]|nr:hypothetical protein GCM10025871_08770 [Deinococcus metallilatus]